MPQRLYVVYNVLYPTIEFVESSPYHSLSHTPGAEGPLSSRPSCSETVLTSLLLNISKLALAASMFTALTFIVSTEGVIYVFFIITDPLCL